MQNAVVVVVEGLGTSLIGAYGASTACTPAIDRLASQGIVLDQCWLDSHDLRQQLRSLWTAQHAMRQADGSEWNLWRDMPKVETDDLRLLTDSQVVAEAAAEFGCQAITLVRPTLNDAAVDDVAQCALMDLFATAAEELATGRPGLVWIHSVGLRLPWDAPLALRQEFMDPEDPDPPTTVHPPELQVTKDTDPDLVVGWGQVASAQAAVVDEAISALVDTVAGRADAAEWTWLFASLGGTPLGEHGQLGFGQVQLHGEELQAAAILSPAPRLPVGMRRPELFQLPDLAETLLCLLMGQAESIECQIQPARPRVWGRNVCALGAPESPMQWAPTFSLAMIATDLQQWIRSPAWSALLNADLSDRESSRLYVKPEDRWEVADIADRRRNVVERHHELAKVFEQAIQRNDRRLLPQLEEELCNLLR
jgi:hypothetical protein